MRMKEAMRRGRWSAAGLVRGSTRVLMSMQSCIRAVAVPTGATRAQVDSLVQEAGGSPQGGYQLATTRAGHWQVNLQLHPAKRTYVRDWLAEDGWAWGVLTLLMFVWPPLLFALQHRFQRGRLSALLRLVVPLTAAVSGVSILVRTTFLQDPLIGGRFAIAAEIALLLAGLAELGSGLGPCLAAGGQTGWVAPARWALAVLLAAAALLPFGGDWLRGSHSPTELAIFFGVHGWALVLCLLVARPLPSVVSRVLMTLFPLFALVSLSLVLMHAMSLDHAVPGAPVTALIQGLLMVAGLVGFGLLFPEEEAPAALRLAGHD